MIPRVEMKPSQPKRCLTDALNEGLYRCLNDAKFEGSPAPDTAAREGDLVMVLMPYNDDPGYSDIWHLRTGLIWRRKSMSMTNLVGNTGLVEVVREFGVKSITLYLDESEKPE